jgi:hypothetical protein
MTAIEEWLFKKNPKRAQKFNVFQGSGEYCSGFPVNK